MVEYLLACGCPDIMSRDVHGATPLHAAAYARRQDVVACLVQFLISQRNNAHLAHNTSWHTREVPSSPSDPGRCATLESKRENLPNPLDPEDASGATPLVLAVRNADLPTVSHLVVVIFGGWGRGQRVSCGQIGGNTSPQHLRPIMCTETLCDVVKQQQVLPTCLLCSAF